MDVDTLTSLLSGLPVPQIRYFETIGSANDEALDWAAAGALDGCLVVADQQSQGRGRFNRRWVTRPGAGLAFSMILRPTMNETAHLSFFSPLGALGISQALEQELGLSPRIKWPNDVLLRHEPGRLDNQSSPTDWYKAAGILVEAAWSGDQIQSIIIGIGLNISPDAVPPADQLMFQATSVEEAAGRPVDRTVLLRAILKAVFEWRAKIDQAEFIQAWEQRLAFRGEWVRIEETARGAATQPITGQIMGMDSSGNLLLRAATGETTAVTVGDVHLRPMNQ